MLPSPLARQVGHDASHFSSGIIASNRQFCLLGWTGPAEIAINFWMFRDMVTTIHAFSETVENEDMGKVWIYAMFHK